MKRTILFFLFISISLTMAAKDKPFIIYGIQLGATMEQVEAKLLEAQNQTPDVALSTTSKLVFLDVEYLEKPVRYLVFEFVDNMLFKVNILIFPPENTVIASTKDLDKKLRVEFGKPKGHYFALHNNVKENDGREAHAIKKCNVSFSSRWSRKNQIGNEQELILFIDSGGFIVVKIKDKYLSDINKRKGVKRDIYDI